MFEKNRNAVENTNRAMFKQIYKIALFICLVLLMVCLFSKSFQRLLPVYGLVAVLFNLLYFGFRNRRHGGIIGLYLFSALLIAGGVCLSVGVSPQGIGGSVLGIFVLVPVVLFDRSWRVAAFMTAAYGVNTILSLVIKTPYLAMIDAVNGACFCIIGILLSRYLQRVKLSDLNSQRLLNIQKNIDCLTGLYTRYRMSEILSDAQETAVRGVIMLDIDWFKHYNDQYGHLEGDVCLKRIGACLKTFGEAHSLTFIRYGGEEFLAFIKCGDFDKVWALAWAMKEAVEALRIPFKGTDSGYVTVSAGCAVKNSDGTPDTLRLIHQADKALYQAKCEGRNRVLGH